MTTVQKATPKKRGRKPISDEEKKRRRNERERKKREAAKAKEQPQEQPQEKPTDEIKEQPVNYESEKTIEDILKEHNETISHIEEEEEQPTGEKTTETKSSAIDTKRISGVILLTVIDAIFPLAIVKLGGLIVPKLKKVNHNKIKLTDDEKQELSEIADEVAGHIEANPILLLSISLGAIYFSKIGAEI